MFTTIQQATNKGMINFSVLRKSIESPRLTTRSPRTVNTFLHIAWDLFSPGIPSEANSHQTVSQLGILTSNRSNQLRRRE